MILHNRMLSIGFILLALAFGAVNYASLPAEIPAHWNLAGEVDGTMPRLWGVLTLPLTMLGLLLLSELFLRFSPRGYRLDQFSRVVGLLINILVAFLLVIYAVQILIARGVHLQMERVIGLGLGLVFLLLGNYMGKLRKNFFIGIRTPWTLASAEVWDRTHRLAGYLFVIWGLVMLVAVLFWGSAQVLIWGLIAICAFLVAYSFILYRRLIGFNNGDEDG
ncbi:SdpI family protein [Microbulbifer sp. SAOS-129_SWC]|uniref:SdpI family protein n=1 Tax=Microbulbifer sp. SAOS-129_SWC TaxID=3145235 RepID=UPI00321667A5